MRLDEVDDPLDALERVGHTSCIAREPAAVFAVFAPVQSAARSPVDAEQPGAGAGALTASPACPRKARSRGSAAVSVSASSRRAYISHGMPSSSLTQNLSAFA